MLKITENWDFSFFKIRLSAENDIGLAYSWCDPFSAGVCSRYCFRKFLKISWKKVQKTYYCKKKNVFEKLSWICTGDILFYVLRWEFFDFGSVILIFVWHSKVVFFLRYRSWFEKRNTKTTFLKFHPKKEQDAKEIIFWLPLRNGWHWNSWHRKSWHGNSWHIWIK